MEVLTVITEVKAIRNLGYFAYRTYLRKSKHVYTGPGAESFGGSLNERKRQLSPSCLELELHLGEERHFS